MKAIILVFVSSVVFGQTYQTPVRVPGFQNHGFGSILNPGGVGPTPTPWPAPVNNTHAGRIGATVSGRPIPGYNQGSGNVGYGNRGGTGVSGYYAYPVAYPVYVPVEAAPAPQPQIINQPAPSVIINNNYTPDSASRPIMREYSAQSLPAPLGSQPERHSRQQPVDQDDDEVSRAKPVVYLLAMKDGGVYSAVAYWLEDTTLHYITPKHDHNHASLELVDRELSDQLNKERKVPFKLSR